ncbi:cupin domain-containing protein [Oricola sp.]|uniref:cupin domain-containing protein n=1 Tax=Oricola sp. TaxID=1979950 RepID=UPI0025D7BA1B|nr:cupin domain-containing protein [Oricola sp.]MCI5076597.1 cupin domain-containing protein [Oricola sp.]
MSFSFIRQIERFPANSESSGWTPHPLLHRTTPSAGALTCHFSVLAPGKTPHPPHVHVEDEILIVLEGEAEIVMADSPGDPDPVVVPMVRGQFSYYPTGQHHTIRNASDSDVVYLMFKWADDGRETALERWLRRIRSNRRILTTETFDLRPMLEVEAGSGFAPTLVMEGPTRWLKRLHCHLSRLKPGAGYETHSDSHDVAIVLLDGEIMTQGKCLKDRGVAFFEAGEPHDMHNPGNDTAAYFVLEFHR